MNMRIAVSAMTALAAIASADVHAQTPDSTQQTVPAELVELLWGPGMLGGRPDLLVGRLPDDLAAAIAPGPDVRIVGSIVSRLATIAAVTMPGDRDRARDLWHEKLVAAGWRAEEPMQEPAGGFEQESPFTRDGSYCSPDDRALRFAVRGHRGDSTLVMFTMSGEGNLGMECGAERQSMAMMRRMESPLPVLRAPGDAAQGRAGSGGGYDEWDSHAELRTDMTPAALVGHYATQFLEQGWQPVAQTLGDAVAIHVFRKTDDERNVWQAVLYVTLLPDGRRDLYVRARRQR